MDRLRTISVVIILSAILSSPASPTTAAVSDSVTIVDTMAAHSAGGRARADWGWSLAACGAMRPLIPDIGLGLVATTCLMGFIFELQEL